MQYLYPSVKELLELFGISTDYRGYDSSIRKMVIKKGDANNRLNFVDNAEGIITCVLNNIVIPMLEEKGIKGLKLIKNKIKGGIQSDIFDFTEVTFEKPEE